MKIKINLNNTNFFNQYLLLKDIDKSFLFGENELKISFFDYVKVKRLIKKYDKGLDLTYDYGYRYFYRDKFTIRKKVFVPQPSTEGILDLVNPKLINGLEVGIGTGVISTSLSKHFKKKMVGIDINKKAIALARENATNNGIHVELKLMDVFKYLPKQKFDFLISNPPYIKIGDPFVEDWVKENQPFEALYADDEGFIFYKHLIKNAERYVRKGGEMYFEFGWNQKNDLENYVKHIGREYNFYKDLEGHWRFMKVSI